VLEETHEAGSDTSPEEVAQQQQDFARLLNLLAQLPDRDRDVLALKYGAALSHRDIARIMGLSESNVAVIAHRTVQGLREQWPAKENE
jgi:RNA polymerase sigma-70 factor (ECF subfamily)